MKSYEWYFFMPDSTYLSASRLLDLVTHTSISNDQVYAGIPEMPSLGPAGSGLCEFGSGILLSQVSQTHECVDLYQYHMVLNNLNIIEPVCIASCTPVA